MALPLAFRFALASACVAGCGDPTVQTTTRFASDFSRAGHSVSIFGVYRDGRMAAHEWEDLAPALAPALGGAACDVFFDAVDSSNPPLADAIDSRAREEGPTDDLLAQLAPAARGDAVLVLTIAGKLRTKAADAGALAATPRRAAGRRRRGAPGTVSRTPSPPADDDALDLSATLYSIAARRSVALVALRYTGASLDEATRAFAAELARSLPGMRCARWDTDAGADAKIDPARVREGAGDDGER
jgi:hypothetical protein